LPFFASFCLFFLPLFFLKVQSALWQGSELGWQIPALVPPFPSTYRVNP
jgi:hypothetical protein